MAITNTGSLQSTYTLPDATTKTVTTTSNTTTTDVLSDEITFVKSSSKTYGEAGDTLTQTVVITNTSSYEMSNISLVDTMSTGASYVEGSVTINGVSYPTYTPTSITLPDSIVATTGTATITYQIQISSPVTATSVTNSVTGTYTANAQQYTGTSNTVTIAVVNNQISVVKSVDTTTAVSGQTLTFTIVITNNGTLTNTGLTFTDAIPSGTTFVTGSVTVDGTTYADYNPATGFALSDLAGGDSTTVTFKVTVD